MGIDSIEDIIIKDIYWRVIAKAVKDYKGTGLSDTIRRKQENIDAAKAQAYAWLHGEYCRFICETIGINQNELLYKLESIEI